MKQKIKQATLSVTILGIILLAVSPVFSQTQSAEDFVRYGDRLARYKTNWRKAIYAYQRALEIDPENARAHIGLGRVFLQRGENLRAAEEFESAFSLAQSKDLHLFEERSDLLEFYLTVAGLMIDKLRQPERAEPYLKMAKELKPDNANLKNLEKETQRIKKADGGNVKIVESFALQIDDPDKKEILNQVINILEDVKWSLARKFDFKPEEIIPLIVLTRLTFQSQAELFLAGSGVGAGKQIVIQTRNADFKSDIFREVLTNQYGMLWLRSYLNYDPPQWLSDGFAVWSQKLIITGAVHVPFNAVDSYRMVDYLIGSSHLRFRWFLSDLKTTRDLPLTLKNVYEISLEELRKQGEH